MAPMPVPISNPPVASCARESSLRLIIFMARVLARIGGNHRQNGNCRVIVARAGQIEGQHADEMHRPYTEAKTQASTGNPQTPCLRFRDGRNVLSDHQGSVRRQYRNENGKADQHGIIVSRVKHTAFRGGDN